MANTIKLKRGSGSDPGASDLSVGEVAVRTDTGKLFTKKDDNSVTEIGVTGNAATATKLETARTIAGVSFDGTANISLNNNAITNGAGYITATLTNEEVQDIVGGMLTGNTETGITVTYQDGDGTIDFVVGTLNQDTTGNAATATALETARNIGGVSFDGTGNINLPGVNTSGNQDTSGNAATATKLAATKNIAGVAFDGSANISLNNNAITNGAGYITDLVSDTTPQLGGNLDTNSFEISLDDDHAVKFGDSSDLEIYHLSSSSINVIRGTLPLTIQTDDTSTGIQLSSYSGGETFAQFKKNGSVDLYHDNSKKFETASGGVSVTGNIVVSGTVDGRDLATDGAKLDGGIMLADGDKGDITVSNSGATFTIDTGVIANGNIASDAAIARTKLANVDVVDDTSPQLGGDLDTNSHNISLDDDHAVKFGDSNDLQILHSNGHSRIRNSTGQLTLAGADVRITNANETATHFLVVENAQVELYHNATKMFETTSSGVKLAKNCQAPLSTLTDGSTITVDFAVASHFTVTLGGNRTFGDPSNLSLSVGSSGSIFIVQDGTGSRTASFHSDYKFVGGTAPTLSTAANAVDRIDYVIKDSSTVHCAVSLDVK